MIMQARPSLNAIAQIDGHILLKKFDAVTYVKIDCLKTDLSLWSSCSSDISWRHDTIFAADRFALFCAS